MGTNFYLKRKLTKEQKEEIKNLIDLDGDYDEIVNKLYDCHPIHIGKRSCGWTFLWDAHKFEYFKPTRESLEEFLRSGQIIDEYNREFTYDQFWNEEIKDWLDNNLLDLDKYYNSPKYDGHWKYRPGEYELRPFKDKVDVNKWGEFYIDNLRFTINEDFS